MFTEKEISQINKSLANQEFETQVGLYPDSVDMHTLTQVNKINIDKYMQVNKETDKYR